MWYVLFLIEFFFFFFFFLINGGNKFLFLAETEIQVELKPDRPYLQVRFSGTAELECCYIAGGSVDYKWVKKPSASNVTSDEITNSSRVSIILEGKDKTTCSILTIKQAQYNDSGIYRCMLYKDKKTPVYTHGTFLVVYKPLEKTIDISENNKNRILTAEGILLVLCVLLPSASLFCQSKRLTELEKRKIKSEEENIYQGLNLDDCCPAYDQILRTQVTSPYQDVDNVIEEEDDIQLEKP
uniref:CD79a molecule, immunoglobulin-associated alpha n=1 Tax=Myripristis murdjan TaxID=586833 RepID=A0A668AG12_9TELE